MLTPHQQRFLARNLALAWEALGDSETSSHLRYSLWGSSAGPFSVTAKGISYDEPDSGRWLDARYLITWPSLAAHRAAQPAELVAALDAATSAVRCCAGDWWELSHPRGVCGTLTEAERSQLDAAEPAHNREMARLQAARAIAAMALLPLASDEPADLIEWAAATA